MPFLSVWTRGALPRLLVLFFCATALSCGSDDTEPSSNEVVDQTEFDEVTVPETCDDLAFDQDCVEPMPNALRLDAEERLGFEAITFDRDAMAILMRLKPGAELPEKIKVGAPIYRARKDRDAFIAIIESVDQRDNEVRVGVRRAELKEVFRRGRLRMKVPIQTDSQALTIEGPTAQMAALRERYQGLTVNLIDFDCRQTVVDDEVPVAAIHSSDSTIPFGGSADVKLELTQCSVKLSGNVNATLVWDGLSPDLFEFTVGADLEIALEGLAELSNIDTYSPDLEIVDAYAARTLKTFPSFSVTVSGIKLKFTPKIVAGVQIVAGGDVSTSAGFTYSLSPTAGFGWAGGRGFYTIFEAPSNFEQLGPTIEQTEDAYVKAFVRPTIEVVMAGLVEGSAALEGYVEIDSEGTGSYNQSGGFDGRVCYDMDAGIEPILGASLVVFTKEIVGESWRLNGVEMDITEGCIDNDSVQPEPSCTPSDECVIDTDCLPEGATSCTVYQCKSDCTCTVYERAGCCESAADCDDSDPYTKDLCFARTGACSHVPNYGYCESDDECNDGLAFTDDSCVDNACVNEQVSALDDVEAELTRDRECFLHTDCDDDSFLTADTCVSGTCRYSNAAVADALTECVTDNDCDDGILFTRDTCQDDGTCRNISFEMQL